jgi:hypothetical protein
LSLDIGEKSGEDGARDEGEVNDLMINDFKIALKPKWNIFVTHLFFLIPIGKTTPSWMKTATYMFSMIKNQ